MLVTKCLSGGGLACLEAAGKQQGPRTFEAGREEHDFIRWVYQMCCKSSSKWRMFEELDLCKGMVAASGVCVPLKRVLSLGELYIAQQCD